VIGLGYVLVGTVSIGSLLLLFSFCDTVGIVPRSSSGNAALSAYTISCTSVILFTIRAELRWRKSVGLDQTLVSKRRRKK
jgi:hypothetical protein